MDEGDSEFSKLHEFINNPLDTDVVSKIDKDMKKILSKFRRSESTAVKSFVREILKANLKSKVLLERGVNIIADQVEVENAAMLKDLAFQLKNEVENLYLVLGANIKGKPNLLVMISENLVAEKNLNAGQIVREAGKEIKGGGGGQPFFATAGGKDVNGIPAAIEKALSFLP